MLTNCRIPSASVCVINANSGYIPEFVACGRPISGIYPDFVNRIPSNSGFIPELPGPARQTPGKSRTLLNPVYRAVCEVKSAKARRIRASFDRLRLRGGRILAIPAASLTHRPEVQGTSCVFSRARWAQILGPPRPDIPECPRSTVTRIFFQSDQVHSDPS